MSCSGSSPTGTYGALRSHEMYACRHFRPTGTDSLQRLPASISIPLIAAADHQGLPPVATYAGENLWNHGIIDRDKPIGDPENLYALGTFTGSTDEAWFFAIPTAVEACGAPIIPLVLEAFDAASSDNPVQLARCLQNIASLLKYLSELIPRMYERCNPAFFYNRIRPFLSGTDSTDLPNGVFYEQENGGGSYRQYKGPTAAQSSLFHFLDIALGVIHQPTGIARDTNGYSYKKPILPGDDVNFLQVSRKFHPTPDDGNRWLC